MALVRLCPLAQGRRIGHVDTPLFDTDRAAALQFLQRAGDDLAHCPQLRGELFLGPLRTRRVGRQLTDQARQPVRQLVERHLTDHAHHAAQIPSEI